MLLLFRPVFSYKRIFVSLSVLLAASLLFSSPVSAVVSSTTPGETGLEPGSMAAGFSHSEFSDASGPSPKNSSDKVKEIYKQDELLVKFKSGSVASERQKVHGKNGSSVIKEFKGLRIHHVKLKKGMTVEKVIELYRSNPLVEYAEPNYIVSPRNSERPQVFAGGPAVRRHRILAVCDAYVRRSVYSSQGDRVRLDDRIQVDIGLRCEAEVIRRGVHGLGGHAERTVYTADGKDCVGLVRKLDGEVCRTLT